MRFGLVALATITASIAQSAMLAAKNLIFVDWEMIASRGQMYAELLYSMLNSYIMDRVRLCSGRTRKFIIPFRYNKHCYLILV